MNEPNPQVTAGPWHSLTADRVLMQVQTSVSGLSHHQAQARLASHGANRLPEAAQRSPLVRFLLQFHNILIYVLLGCALVTAALGHWIDTGACPAPQCCCDGQSVWYSESVTSLVRGRGR